MFESRPFLCQGFHGFIAQLILRNPTRLKHARCGSPHIANAGEYRQRLCEMKKVLAIAAALERELMKPREDEIADRGLVA